MMNNTSIRRSQAAASSTRALAGLLAALLGLPACDPFRVVRTTLTASVGFTLTEECAAGALKETTRWRIEHAADGRIYIQDKDKKAFLVSFEPTRAGGLVSLSAATLAGAGVLENIATLQLEVAAVIARRCSPGASIRCAESSGRVERCKG